MLTWAAVRRLAPPLAVAVVAFFAYRSATAPVTVDVATVTSAYPSQGFTVLNATGRVVAGRKAAISTKATGRWSLSHARVPHPAQPTTATMVSTCTRNGRPS